MNMKPGVLASGASILTLALAATVAIADTTKHTANEPRNKSEANTLARRQALCAKYGKVALATRVGDTLYYRCILPDDVTHRAQ